MDIQIGTRVRRLGLTADGPDWRVTVDDRSRHVSLVRAGASWSLLIADDTHPERVSRSYEVTFERALSGDVLVHVDGTVVPVSLPGRAAGVGRRAGVGGSRTRGGQVVAPMPGRVVSVLVEPGDLVHEKQGVIVLEAMKMQNEVRAGRPGVVTEVRVTKGAAVDAGAVLVVIGDAKPAELG
jgi:biotin carboxyl carrier protein